MNQKSFENDGEYIAQLYTRNKRGMYSSQVTELVVPIRVYKGGKGRLQIEFDRGNGLEIRENWPGASTFELYRRVA